jgi:hypothetical protein
MNRHRMLTLVALMAACSQAGPTHSTRAAIQGGAPDSGDAAVVLLFRPPGTQGPATSAIGAAARSSRRTSS